MLDKDLCKLFGVPPFLEWIQNQLDDLEDALYSGELEPDAFVRVKVRYDALREARDTYCSIERCK